MSSQVSRSRAILAGLGVRPRRAADRAIARATGLLHRALLALGLMALLAFGFAGWAVTAELSGAIIAPGHVVVEQSSKRIQHPIGGVVTEILVANGQRVAAGDVLMRLDGTQSGAVYEVVAAKLLQLRGERARLVAERDRLPTPRFDDIAKVTGDRTEAIMAGEKGHFEARKSLIESQKSRLRLKIEQIRREMRAIDAQRAAKIREVELIRRELAVVEELSRRQLSNITRLTDMQRQLARFEGEQAALSAQHARAEAQIHEVELQIVELDQRTLTDAHKELREIEARIEELVERQKAAKDQLTRTDLRAPVSGTVHELAVHTIGGVVRAGDTIMQVVPDTEALSIEARIATSDIDHVAVGRRANLRLTAMDQRTTPELAGTVVHVGADSTRDPSTGRYYYSVRIGLRDDERRKLGTFKLVPGMPVEGFIETAPRTLLAYLLKPLQDSLARSMREP